MIKVLFFALGLLVSQVATSPAVVASGGAHDSRGLISVDDGQDALEEVTVYSSAAEATAGKIEKKADNGLTGIDSSFNIAPGDQKYVLPSDWSPSDHKFECWGEKLELDGIYTMDVGWELVHLCENGGFMVCANPQNDNLPFIS